MKGSLTESRGRMKSYTQLVKGEAISIENRHLIPIYKIVTTASKDNPQLVLGEVGVKGLLVVEEEEIWYISLDKELMKLDTLMKEVLGLEESLKRLQ